MLLNWQRPEAAYTLRTIQYSLKSLQQALLYGMDRSNMGTAQSLLCVKRWKMNPRPRTYVNQRQSMSTKSHRRQFCRPAIWRGLQPQSRRETVTPNVWRCRNSSRSLFLVASRRHPWTGLTVQQRFRAKTQDMATFLFHLKITQCPAGLRLCSYCQPYYYDVILRSSIMCGSDLYKQTTTPEQSGTPLKWLLSFI